MAAECLTVETTSFGAIEVDETSIIRFPKGLLGFEERRRYILIEDPDHQPFAHLQSADDPSLAFIIVNPKLFFPNYKVQVDRPEIAELSVTDLSRVTTWVIVTVPEEIASMSANLQGPVLINRDKNLGKQVVLMRSPYTTRHYLLDELNKTPAKPKTGSKPRVPAGAPV